MMPDNMSQPLGTPLWQVWQICVVAALLGVASHLVYYVKSDHEPQIISIVFVHLVLVPAMSTAIMATHNLAIASLLGFVPFWISFHLGLVLSMIMYRVLFHPLRRMPGPFWAKITKIPTIVTAHRGKLHELHTQWARKYGPIVRIGQYPEFKIIGNVSG